MTKAEIFQLLIARLETMLDTARAEQEFAQKEANYHIGAMQSRYDTFKEEAQYLVEAQKRQIAELSAAQYELKHILAVANQSKHYTHIVSGCAVVILHIEEDSEILRFYLLSPFGGGEEFELDGTPISLLSTGTALAQALLYQTQGAVVEYRDMRGAIRCVEVMSVV